MGKSPSSVASVLGLRVKYFRLKNDWTQSELAERAGISQNHLSSIERGSKFPAAELIESLASVFDVHFYELFINPADQLRNSGFVSDESITTLEDEVGRVAREWVLRISDQKGHTNG